MTKDRMAKVEKLVTEGATEGERAAAQSVLRAAQRVGVRYDLYPSAGFGRVNLSL